MSRRPTAPAALMALIALVLIAAACRSGGPVRNVPPPTVYKTLLWPPIGAFLEESSETENSSDPNWWLSSGGRISVEKSIAHAPTIQTIHGKLMPGDKWHTKYQLAKGPDTRIDTDDGTRPQNLFRLVLRRRMSEVDQTFYFRIDAVNLSSSPQRGGQSGIFAMSRYGDKGATLYCAGFRMDGRAVIEKKDKKLPNGSYILSIQPTFHGAYHHQKRPNLIPTGQWIGIRNIVSTDANGKVVIQLFSDFGNPGQWQGVLTARDSGAGGVPAITSRGYAGIRSDFMDVSFKEFTLNAPPNI